MKTNYIKYLMYLLLFIIAFTIILYYAKNIEPEIFILLRKNEISEKISDHYVSIHFSDSKEVMFADAYFSLGIYKPDSGPSSFNSYGKIKKDIDEFLDQCIDEFEDNAVISVDGLKFQKETIIGTKNEIEYSYSRWTPYPNPPIPTLDPLDPNGPRKHIFRYAKWINDHPHFGYPPLPIPLDEINRQLGL